MCTCACYGLLVYSMCVHVTHFYQHVCYWAFADEYRGASRGRSLEGELKPGRCGMVWALVMWA